MSSIQKIQRQYGRKASRYVEDIIAKKCRLSKVEVRRIVNNT